MKLGGAQEGSYDRMWLCALQFAMGAMSPTLPDGWSSSGISRIRDRFIADGMESLKAFSCEIVCL